MQNPTQANATLQDRAELRCQACASAVLECTCRSFSWCLMRRRICCSSTSSSLCFLVISCFCSSVLSLLLASICAARSSSSACQQPILIHKSRSANQSSARFGVSVPLQDMKRSITTNVCAVLMGSSASTPCGAVAAAHYQLAAVPGWPSCGAQPPLSGTGAAVPRPSVNPSLSAALADAAAPQACRQSTGVL